MLPGRFAGVGQLPGPGLLFAGIDFEKTRPIKTAREAILSASDREFLIARTHESLTRPFAAAVIIDSIDVIETCSEIAAKQRLAVAGRKIPPPLRGPTLAILVAERNTDTTLGDIADAEIGGSARCRQRRQEDQYAAEREG